MGDPVAERRYEYTMGDGMPKRGWKETLKNLGTGALAGAAQGGIVGAIGGAAGMGIRGAFDPAGAKEMRFNTWQAPRMIADQQRKQNQSYGQAQIGRIHAQTQHEQTQDEIARRNAGLAEEKQRHEIGKPQILNEGDQVFTQGQPGFKNPRTYDPAGIKRIETTVAEGKANRESREKIAGQTDKTRRETAAMTEGGRRTRHESGGADGNRKATADRWYQALQEAIQRSNGKQDTPEIQRALTGLRSYPEFYETGIGEGEWPYAKPKQGSAPTGGGKQILMSKLKANGLTRAQAEVKGYSVIDD